MRIRYSVCLLLIGLVPSACQDEADMELSVVVDAEIGNMREMYNWMTMYKNQHQKAWPQQTGQGFLLELWQSGVMEHNEKNARRFFSAAETYAEWMEINGCDPTAKTPVDYLSDLEGRDSFAINFAAFDPQGDPDLADWLNDAPETITIMANATFAHREWIYYMTGDGDVFKLSIQDLINRGLLTEEDWMLGEVPVGKDSPIEELRTVTTN